MTNAFACPDPIREGRSTELRLPHTMERASTKHALRRSDTADNAETRTASAAMGSNRLSPMTVSQARFFAANTVR